MTLVKTWTYPTLERLVAEDGDHTVTKIGWQYEGTEGAAQAPGPWIRSRSRHGHAARSVR